MKKNYTLDEIREIENKIKQKDLDSGRKFIPLYRLDKDKIVALQRKHGVSNSMLAHECNTVLGTAYTSQKIFYFLKGRSTFNLPFYMALKHIFQVHDDEICTEVDRYRPTMPQLIAACMVPTADYRGQTASARKRMKEMRDKRRGRAEGVSDESPTQGSD